MTNLLIHSNIILVNKPPGMTSAFLLNRLKPFIPGKIGHTGTLDPFAGGLIIVLKGNYTRLTPFFSIFPKEYRVELLMGQGTDTLDITGETTQTDNNWTKINSEAIQNSLLQLKGTIQYPAPLYSAKKVKGRRLYEYARKKKEVTPPLCTSHIYEIHSIEIEPPRVSFTIQCSTGTYIRALAVLLGNTLNTSVTISTLYRTAIGQSSIDYCHHTLQVFTDMAINYNTAKLDSFLPQEHIQHLSSGEYQLLRNGAPYIREKIIQQMDKGPYMLLKVEDKNAAFVFNPVTFPIYQKPRVVFLYNPL